MLKLDLHLHTSFSDGELSIKELLTYVTNLEISLISLTDHDTMIHLTPYREWEKQYGICIIPGIEVSAEMKGMHILGYGIQKMQFVEDELTKVKLLNQEICEETILLLAREGIPITASMVREEMQSELMTNRDIAKFLEAHGVTKYSHEAYEKYMGKGQKAYIPIHKIAYEEVLSLIQSAGGIAVLAHPYTLGPEVDLGTLLKKMKDCGLAGIETDSVRRASEEQQFFHELAKKYELVETAGSDFHRFSDHIEPGMWKSDDFVERFYRALEERKS